MSEVTTIRCDLCGHEAEKGTEGWARLGPTITQGEIRYSIPGAYWQKHLDICPTCMAAEPRFRASAGGGGFAKLTLEETS